VGQARHRRGHRQVQRHARRIDPSVIVADENVAIIRKQRADQQAAAQMAAQAPAMASAAKDASQVDGDNLRDVTRQVHGIHLMATKQLAVSEAPGDGFIVRWLAMGDADDGAPFSGYGSRDRSVQFVGVFAGASVLLEGSNDNANWVVLTDPQGNNITKTSASLEAISEATRYVRPRTSGGGGTAVDVYLFIGGPR
jgi:hypothetical protein